MSKQVLQQTGTVQSFNISPKGSYEGFLLESNDGLIQINFRQEWSATVAELAEPGAHIQIKVERYDGDGHPAAHPVYQLVSIGGEETFSLSEAKGAEDDGHFSGKVERLNYALHGEVNGAVLDTGDFLHVKPHAAAALNLRAGMHVEGTGTAKPMVGGHRVIEADTVNGIAIEKKPKPKKKAHH